MSAVVKRLPPAEQSGETVPVQVVVLGIEPITAGLLVGLAAVELLIDGIEIIVQGVQILRTGPRSLGVSAPTFRCSTGTATPAVLLPPELAQAVCDAVLLEYDGKTN
jgi:hypothetical protein